jgi:hypothetical protein
MNMTVQRNESNSNGQTLKSYDPLIWRKDVNVIAKKLPENFVFDSENVEIKEKNVENIFWANVYLKTRP